MAHSDAFKVETLKLAEEIGPQRAAKQQGVSYNTVRRWRDPAFKEREAAGSRVRKSVPCRQCGRQATRYGRKRPEHEGLCRSCINTMMADEDRGSTVAEMRDMYLVEKLSTNQIATRTHRSQSSVHALLVDNGVPMRTAAESIALGKAQAKLRDPIDTDDIMALRQQGLSVNAIASRLGHSVGAVQYWLGKLGDPR